ncbi:unnamed protein product [Urochloa humidicola]
MSRWVESSSARGGASASRREIADPIGEESGLPLIVCPKCNGARLIERRSKKENANLGRVYIKCPRDKSWMPDRCDYYNWQRNYFQDLVDRKVIVVMQGEDQDEGDDQEEEEREVQSVSRGKDGRVQSKKIEENVEKLMKAMQLLIIMMFSVCALLVVLFLLK